MARIEEWIKGCNRIGITGHIRPDGDCLGSCTALRQYILDIYPQAKVDLYLEMVPEKFLYLAGAKEINTEYPDAEPYDVFFCLDSAELERIGKSEKYFETAKKKIVIDHHISNPGYGEENVILPEASSACEVLYDLLEEDSISKETAISLYTGIIHDTGVLKYSNVSEKTMQIVGKLVDKDIPFSKIIDESFFQKTYLQNRILGKALLDSKIYLDGKVILSALSMDTMKEFEVISADLDGVIDQLRITKGVEVAVLMHETEENVYKLSFRSNNDVDVNKVASNFGGGGHIKAAGATAKGNLEDVINEIMDRIAEQL